MSRLATDHTGRDDLLLGGFITTMGATLLLVTLASLDILNWATVFAFSVGLLATRFAGRRLAVQRDVAWLPTLLPIAFIVVMLGGVAHYYLAHVFQGGSAGSDAETYYRIGVEIAPQLRQLQWPEALYGTMGTENTSRITGVFYLITGMDVLGGYLLFSCVSFAGLLLFYLAFRRSTTSQSLKLYFVGVFFLPTVVYWPSAIGKDALVMLFMGLTAFGTARIFSNQPRSGVMLAIVGVASAYAIRPPLAVMLIGAIAVGSVASLLSDESRFRTMPRRIAILAVVVAALFVVVPVVMTQVGIDEGLVSYAQETQQRTAIGESVIEPTPILSIASLPRGIIAVIGRPFLHEASSAVLLVASLEGLLLLFLLALSLPRMAREGGRFFRQPYFAFSLAFTLEFIVAFSVVANLGLLVRQRAQMFPFLLTVVVLFSPLADRYRSDDDSHENNSMLTS